MTPLADKEDAALLAELRECGLVTPATVERISAELGRPESIALDRFLLAGRAWIDGHAWLAWLIRRRGCSRFGPVAANEVVFAAAGSRDLSAEPNLPYRMTADGRTMFAVLRPDRRAATARRVAPGSALWAAATLDELHALREAWRREQRWGADE